MHIGVISFPGSSGDLDVLTSLEADLGVTVRRVDYREQKLAGLDAVVLPGGFSWGDALRAGAIARHAPVMAEVGKVAKAGMPVLGIDNGFQILCEAQILPGTLLQNSTLRFHSSWRHIRIEQTATPWTQALSRGQILHLPVAHGQGQYFIGAEHLDALEANGQIVARYSTADGDLADEANPAGSVGHIAAVCNAQRNVVGLMPHPDRATSELIGGSDGLAMLRSILTTTTV